MLWLIGGCWVIYFSHLFKTAKNKFELITTFLALLELIRLKEVKISQDGHFGEIEIARNLREPEKSTWTETN